MTKTTFEVMIEQKSLKTYTCDMGLKKFVHIFIQSWHVNYTLWQMCSPSKNVQQLSPQGGIYPHIKFERDTFFELRALTSSGSSGPKYNCCPYLALLTFIYHYLPIFGLFRLNYPYLGIFAPNYTEFTICAIYTLYNVFFY